LVNEADADATPRTDVGFDWKMVGF
jgi:hypothetical protein